MFLSAGMKSTIFGFYTRDESQKGVAIRETHSEYIYTRDESQKRAAIRETHSEYIQEMNHRREQLLEKLIQSYFD